MPVSKGFNLDFLSFLSFGYSLQIEKIVSWLIYTLLEYTLAKGLMIRLRQVLELFF